MRSNKIVFLTCFILFSLSLSSCEFIKRITRKPEPIPTKTYYPVNDGQSINMQKLAKELHKRDGYVDNINFYNIYFNQFKELRELLGQEKNHVSTLNLSGNFSSSVEDTFPQYYAKYLYFIQVLGDKKNEIITLNLDNNNFNNRSAIILAKMLRHKNNNITALSLRNNLIGNEGVYALASALTDPNCKLTSIDLSRNTFNDRARNKLEQVVAKLHDKRPIKVVIN